MIHKLVVVLVLVGACSKSSDPKPDQKTTAAAGSATEMPTQVEAEQFCAKCYFKMMDCFKDAEFWQIFSTMYFANTTLTSDDTEREHWIGIMKEDMLKLYNEKGFEENCRATLEHNKGPTTKNIKTVNEAGAKSCSAFGSAFGYMVFNEGVFHQPK